MSTKESVLRGKTPVQLLQEMCLKMNTSLPTYQFQGEESSPLGKNMKIFSHIVYAMDYEATGIGRSKQDSKHEAAWQLIRAVLKLPADESDDLAAAAEDRNVHAAVELVTDRVNQLRDICIQRNFPLPDFELVRSYGPSHAPVFEYEVRIRDIVRRGSHSTKKGAKQIACQEMIKTLQELPVDECFLQVQSLDDALQEEEMTNDQLIRTYREYTQSDNKKKLGVPLAERHKYFLELPKERISEAYRIMQDQHETVREKCSLIPTALGLKFKITPNNILLPTKRGYNMSTFDLLSPDYDCFIFGQGDEFYSEVYQYFCRMLNFQQTTQRTNLPLIKASPRRREYLTSFYRLFGHIRSHNQREPRSCNGKMESTESLESLLNEMLRKLMLFAGTDIVPCIQDETFDAAPPSSKHEADGNDNYEPACKIARIRD